MVHSESELESICSILSAELFYVLYSNATRIWKSTISMNLAPLYNTNYWVTSNSSSKQFQ